jgi:carbonic anhydrase
LATNPAVVEVIVNSTALINACPRYLLRRFSTQPLSGRKTMNDTLDISADSALQRLKTGNERFLRGEAHLRGLPCETLAELARGQQPFATILGCSDSRVPPEWIFDAGLGELFVIRVAGNVLSPEIAGSIQYAVAHLQTPLLVVLGHEGCGAIQAALETKYQGVRQHSRIQLLVDTILPALAGLGCQLPPLTLAVESNVRWAVRTILETPEGLMRLAEGRVKIIGAVYEIETGRVRFLDNE